MPEKKKCEACSNHTLTPEEIAYKDGTRCYYCILKTRKDFARIAGSSYKVKLPEAGEFGRSTENLPGEANDVLEELEEQKNPTVSKFKEFTPADQAEFLATYGWAPTVPGKPTVIVVRGTNDDTWLKISLGAPATIENAEIFARLQDLAQTTLDTICQIATFGQMNARATMNVLGKKQQSGNNPFE
tara:strand:- start:436 stop:993 length:558 start_codon:yes stop_codon:yes gene_type:complete